jgi:cystathionine beta-lyase/cystathionine gamma-synthase
VWKVASLDSVDAIYEGRAPGFLYARDGHPNLVELATKIADLEHAEAAWIGASGMAVESALLLTLLKSGDHVALADGVYGKTGRLTGELERFGVTAARFDPTRPETLSAALHPRTRLVFAETISNPLLRLADIPELARAAHSAGAMLAIDNTFAPGLCRPTDLGADFVIHSLTKLIGGHSDLTQGAIAGCAAGIAPIAVLGSTFGLTGNAFECWLAFRGLATLSVRSARACATAHSLATWLQGQPAVRQVHYPGLATHPDSARAATHLDGGFGTILTLDLGSRQRADVVIRALASSIPFAPSLGDVTTTLSHPATTSHRGQSEELWRRQGITPGLIRISTGLEEPGHLQRELGRALQHLD